MKNFEKGNIKFSLFIIFFWIFLLYVQWRNGGGCFYFVVVVVWGIVTQMHYVMVPSSIIISLGLGKSATKLECFLSHNCFPKIISYQIIQEMKTKISLSNRCIFALFSTYLHPLPLPCFVTLKGDRLENAKRWDCCGEFCFLLLLCFKVKKYRSQKCENILKTKEMLNFF